MFNRITVQMRWLRSPLFLSLLLLSVAISIAVALNPARAINMESLVLAPAEGQILVARLFTPKSLPPPHPALLLLHGINNSKTSLAPLAVELARRGIAAIALDFRGYGESSPRPPDLQAVEDLERTTLEDARAFLHYLRKNPERFDSEHLGVAGHSLGGATALQLARLEPDLRATVLLSMGGTATLNSPANLLYGVGTYEQINPASQLREEWAAATEGCAEGESCGNFEGGTARKLVISPTADHIIAPYNAPLLQEAVDWTQRALNLPSPSQPITVSGYLCALVVAFGSAIASGVAFLLHAGRNIAASPPNLRRWYRRFVTGLLAFAIATMGVMGATGAAPSSGAARMMLLAYLLQLFANYALREPKKVPAAAGIAGLYVGLANVALLLPALLCGLPELARKPADLLFLPQFVLQWPLLVFYNYLQAARLIFFPRYSLDLSVSWLFWGAVAVELFAPGATLKAVERMGVGLVERLRRPWVLAGVGRLSGAKMGLIGALLLVLMALLRQRSADGLLDKIFSDGALVARSLGLLVIFPLGAIVLTLRSRFFQRWERAFSSSSDS